MGLGKSKLVLDVINYRMKTRPYMRTLILCPFLINLDSWEEQIQEHAPNLSYTILTGSSKDRIAQLQNSDSSLYVLNYTGLCAMVSTLREKPRAKNKKGQAKKEWVIDSDKIAAFCDFFDGLVCDESTALKNHQTITYKACLTLSYHLPFRYLLTGTPFGSTPHDVWAQYMVLDHGATFGRTLGIFRQAFFKEKINYWNGYEYIFDKKKTDLFTKKLENRSIHYSMDECLDLPEQIQTTLYFNWPTEQKGYYDTLKESFIRMMKSSGNVVEVKNHFMRLRQLTSGFLMHKDEDESTIVRFDQNPKIDGLLELLEQADPTDKFIVFQFFIETGAMISDALTSKKIRHSRIWSGTSDNKAEFRKFANTASNRVLIINESIGALGLNLQMANYLIFFEPPVSPIKREQAEARCRRPGQKKTVFCYDFAMRDSIDLGIVRSTRNGKDFLAEVLAGKEDA